MASLIGALFLIALLGYFAQTTGLCMVRGVNEWLKGRPLFMLAILFSGVWAWVAASASYYAGLSPPFKVFEANAWFALGGLLFGLGTAFNQGCSVSTFSKLARGHLQMSATLIGWIVGWCTLDRLQPDVTVVELAPPSLLTYGALAVLSVIISFWALRGDRPRQKL